MKKILKNHRGLNIVGQGGKIILFFLPVLVAAIVVQIYFPSAAMLPVWLTPVGYGLLGVGLVFWGTAVFQLLTRFGRGQLITDGAYGIVRNPIYASMMWFILPAAACLSRNPLYLLTAVVLGIGVQIFIRAEERQLGQVFGREYADYLARVDRLVPFKKP